MFETSTNPPPRRRSVGVRLLILAVLTLVFGIPLQLVRSIVEERQSLRAEALAGIRQSWGGPQTLAGPLLRIERSCLTRHAEQPATRHYAHFWQLPTRYDVQGQVEAKPRRKGIHETVVLLADLSIAGSFTAADDDFPAGVCDSTRLERVVVELGLTDGRALDRIEDLTWNGRRLRWQAGASRGGPWGSGLHAVLPEDLAQRAVVEETPFAVRMAVKASDSLRFLPLGDPTRVQLASPWKAPGFTGAYLPGQHSLTPAGFSATWDVPLLARPFANRSRDTPPRELAGSEFGAEWIVPADGYLRTERALKYGLMFVGATFACLYFFELFGRRALHPMHYLLVGAALIVFYLLLLSLSEQLGFTIAYGLATGATTFLVSGYAVSILGGWLRGASLGAALAGFYAALFLLLRAEDHALLVGSIGLFAALAVVMWLTRRIDWSNPRLGDAAEQP